MQLFASQGCAHFAVFSARRLNQDAALGIEIWVRNIDLEQEPVQLGFGQGVGAFLFDRVLRRQHMEGRGQIVAHPGDGHMMLLHGLQEGRLGPRAGRLISSAIKSWVKIGLSGSGSCAGRSGSIQHFRPDNV